MFGGHNVQLILGNNMKDIRDQFPVAEMAPLDGDTVMAFLAPDTPTLHVLFVNTHRSLYFSKHLL